MAVITPEIKEFIKNNLGWITTVSKDGELDLGPKMSLFVLDDTHNACTFCDMKPVCRLAGSKRVRRESNPFGEEDE